MRFGSVCSGIEAASQAWNPLGWKASWFSEIEPFPCAVLAHHHPETPNLGDMTKFEGWPDDEQHAIDLLCGGTPCQSFSVAGLREGLDDPRGNLMLTFGAIAAKYRPKWLVWENVPGVLSSNEGRDFASFLGLLSGQSIAPPPNGWDKAGVISGDENAYGLAYRVLDAQYFGVAQRRRRVFVVGYLGDWRRAAAVLLERNSLSGDIAPNRDTQKTTTRSTGASALASGVWCGTGRPESAKKSTATGASHSSTQVAEGVQHEEVAGTLEASLGRSRGAGTPVSAIIPVAIDRAAFNQGTNALYEPLIEESETMSTIVARGPHAVLQGTARMVAFGEYVEDDTASTIKQRDYKDATDLVTYGIPGNWIGRKPENGGNAVEPMLNIAPCLTKTDQHCVVAPMVVHGTQDSCVSDIAFTQGRNNGGENVLIQPVAYAFDSLASNSMKSNNPDSGCNVVDIAKTIDTTRPDPSKNQGGNGILHAMQVRRLTATECERLQGFPDGYTNIPWRTAQEATRKGTSYETLLNARGMTLRGPSLEECPDGPRYQSLGNSWAVPNIRWLGERIEAVERLMPPATLEFKSLNTEIIETNEA